MSWVAKSVDGINFFHWISSTWLWKEQHGSIKRPTHAATNGASLSLPIVIVILHWLACCNVNLVYLHVFVSEQILSLYYHPLDWCQRVYYIVDVYKIKTGYTVCLPTA